MSIWTRVPSDNIKNSEPIDNNNSAKRGSILYLTLVIGFRCNNKAASFRSQAFHMYNAFGVLSV